MPMSQLFTPGVAWFVLGLIFLFLEFILPGIIIGFFGVGAILTAVLYWVGILDSLTAQLICFLVSSLLLLFVLRRYLKKLFVGKTTTGRDSDEMDNPVGKTAKVVEDIKKDGSQGRIVFEGTEWKALSTQDIPAGSIVTITDKDNITYTVKKSD